MKSNTWDDAILADHRSFIKDATSREAFDRLVAAAIQNREYETSPGWQGEVRIFKYIDPASSERPFAFIVNRNSLLFYIRKAGLPRIRSRMHEADNGLASFEHTDGGELKVRIRTPDEAATLHRIIFGRPDREVLKSETNSSIDHATQGQGMTILKIHAARVRQGDLTLYTTSMTVSDLMRPGFYSVETLDPANTNDKGFQRLLNTARAKKLADYIVSGQDSRDAFLPTSVFLATDKALPFDEHSRSLEINIQEVGAFSVVDGQHRLEGLRMAAEKDARVLSFEVPVNIAVDLPPIAQMCHFLIVNTTQKSVDKSVEQRIIKRLTDAIDVEDLPSLPKWISRTLDKGEIDQAIRYVDFLNETVDSPWYQKIEMANKPSATATVTQKTFVKALVKYVLTPNNPLTAYRDAEKERRIFLNYWKAIDGLLNDGNAAVLFKYNGVELFCKFSIPFFTKLQDKGDFTVKRMTEMLDETFKNVEGEYAGVGHPNWWASGSNASFLNAGAVNQVYHEMTRALHKGAGASTSELKL